MREPQKSALAQAFWSHGDCSLDENYEKGENIDYVIDGGSLLQRIPWEKASTFGTICYKNYEYLHSFLAFYSRQPYLRIH